jgi:hypothetical protein
MPQLNIRIPTKAEMDFINDALNDVADKYPSEVTNKALGLKKIVQIYNDEVKGLQFKELPVSINETLKAADCDYLKWNDIIACFECYETIHKNKKKFAIDSEHDKVLEFCTLCKKGKSDAIKTRIEEGFRKKGINNLFNLTKLLIRMDIEGAVAQIFLCQAKQFTDDEIIISPDCVHMKCPQQNSELVLIEGYCTTQINPFDMNPPCQYLVAPFLRVPIKPHPEGRAVMDEILQLEQKDEESQPKEVDATVIETEIVEPQNPRDIIAAENEEKEEEEND